MGESSQLNTGKWQANCVERPELSVAAMNFILLREEINLVVGNLRLSNEALTWDYTLNGKEFYGVLVSFRTQIIRVYTGHGEHGETKTLELMNPGQPQTYLEYMGAWTHLCMSEFSISADKATPAQCVIAFMCDEHIYAEV